MPVTLTQVQCSTLWYLRRRQTPADRVVLDWTTWPIGGVPKDAFTFGSADEAIKGALYLGITDYKLREVS